MQLLRICVCLFLLDFVMLFGRCSSRILILEFVWIYSRYTVSSIQRRRRKKKVFRCTIIFIYLFFFWCIFLFAFQRILEKFILLACRSLSYAYRHLSYTLTVSVTRLQKKPTKKRVLNILYAKYLYTSIGVEVSVHRYTSQLLWTPWAIELRAIYRQFRSACCAIDTHFLRFHSSPKSRCLTFDRDSFNRSSFFHFYRMTYRCVCSAKHDWGILFFEKTNRKIYVSFAKRQQRAFYLWMLREPLRRKLVWVGAIVQLSACRRKLNTRLNNWIRIYTGKKHAV